MVRTATEETIISGRILSLVIILIVVVVVHSRVQLGSVIGVGMVVV